MPYRKFRNYGDEDNGAWILIAAQCHFVLLFTVSLNCTGAQCPVKTTTTVPAEQCPVVFPLDFVGHLPGHITKSQPLPL